MMSTFLIEVAFGPVQGFIAASRRSRDLWGGSYILSEIARAAAASLLHNNAELIYPLQTRVEKINSKSSSVSPEDDGIGSSNLSNVLLAKLPDANEERAAWVANQAMVAGKTRLSSFADETLQQWQHHVTRRDIWAAQVDDAIECFSAWANMDGIDYQEAYKRLKKTFAARKNTRDFSPAMYAMAGVPKSSLDGLRESVLPPNKKLPPQFGVGDGEQLDALGVIKRHVGRQESFTALTRLAADSWLENKLSNEDRKQLIMAYEPLVKLKLATRVSGNKETYANFPYDASLLYADRLNKAISAGINLEQLEHLRAVLRPIWKRYGHPCPYAAILMGDGDRMGKCVSAAQSPDEHTRISRQIAEFADTAIVSVRKHRGHMLYAGGEDILALLPLSSVIDAPRELAKAFNDKVSQLSFLKKDQIPTLRVGVAICHVLEPLGRIRQYAEEAEKYAKGEAGTSNQGNALGLRLHVRVGHDIPIRILFDDDNRFEMLEQWRKAYEQGVFPGRLAYDTRDIGERCKKLGYSDEVARAEFKRLCQRAKESVSSGLQNNMAAWQQLDTHFTMLEENCADFSQALIDLGNELVLSRWAAAKTAADVGESA